jgi:hypothetical protein
MQPRRPGGRWSARALDQSERTVRRDHTENATRVLVLLKPVLQFSVFFFLGYLSLSFGAGVFVAEGTLHPGRRLLSNNDEMQAEGMARSHDSELAGVTVTAGDGAALRG